MVVKHISTDALVSVGGKNSFVVGQTSYTLDTDSVQLAETITIQVLKTTQAKNMNTYQHSHEVLTGSGQLNTAPAQDLSL